MYNISKLIIQVNKCSLICWIYLNMFNYNNYSENTFNTQKILLGLFISCTAYLSVTTLNANANI